jgi:HK97 family phage prohead protease
MIKHATYGAASAASDPRVPSVSITIDDAKRGEFTALVSIIGNVDLQGDVVVSGAFTKSLERLRQSGNPVPVVWSHDWTDPFAHVGFAWPSNIREAKAGEFPRAPQGGLLVRGRFDVDKPFAKQVYDLVRERRVTEWSFAYDVVKQRKRSDGANELLVLDLLEVGPTLKGANEMTTTIDVKARRSDSSAEKKAKASSILQMVEDTANGDADRYIPGLYGEVGHAMRFTIDDPDSDVDDVISAASAVIDRHIRQSRWRNEDEARSAKLADRAVKAQLDDLIADLSVGEKAVRHQSPNESDVIDMRRHLSRSHANQINSVQDVERMQLEELVAAHRTMHALMSKAADDLIADVKSEKARDDAARKKFEDANRNLLAGPIDWAAQDAYDRARADRERQELEVKWQERKLEADRREAAETIARSQPMTPTGAYWSDTAVQDVDDGSRERVTPRITDATVPDEGTTFRAPMFGTPDSTPLRVEPDEVVREVAPETGETYRVLPFAVTDTPQTVPQQAEEHFSIPVVAREDSLLLENEQPLPTEPETIGESFQLPTGGVVRRSVDAMEDGETL